MPKEFNNIPLNAPTLVDKIVSDYGGRHSERLRQDLNRLCSHVETDVKNQIEYAISEIRVLRSQEDK